MAGIFAQAAAQRVTQAALALPRALAPRFVYIGAQMYIPHVPAGAPPSVAEARSAGEGSPLVPSKVRPSPLAVHRMITYRARMMALLEFS